MTHRILFVSRTNSSWTLVAEALVRSLISDVHVESAGADLTVDGTLPDVVSHVLGERGVEFDGIRPTPLGSLAGSSHDIVVIDSEISWSVLGDLSNLKSVLRVSFCAPDPTPYTEEKIAPYRLLYGDVHRWIRETLTPICDPCHAGERAMQLNTWIDDRRKSLYDRTSVVLAADSILTAAAFVLLNLVPSLFKDANEVLELGATGSLYVGFLMATAALLFVSIGLSTAGLGNIFTGRNALWRSLDYDDEEEMPSCFPLYPPEIDKIDARTRRYGAYETKFNNILTNDAQLVKAAAVQFRVTSREFSKRYRRHFRWSVRLLLFSIIPFVGALVALVATFVGTS